MLLYGKQPVSERIRFNPGSIKKLFLQKKIPLPEIVKESKRNNISFESVEKKWIEKNYPGLHTQGVVAVVSEFKYKEIHAVIDEAVSCKIVPVLLDGVTDPQNLGSIMRNLACLGGFSLVLPKHGSAEVTETVLRVACGGENHLSVAIANNLGNIIRKMKDAGIWIVGATGSGAENIIDADFQYPMAVVMGSEGKGIRQSLLKNLDSEMFIPMGGAKLSYNVAVATSIFCYEVYRKLK